MSYSQTDWDNNYFDCNLTSMGHPMTVISWWKKNNTQWGDGGADYAWNMAYNFTTDQNQLRCFGAPADGASVAAVDTGSTNTTNVTFTPDSFNDEWVAVIVVKSAANARRVYVGSSANKSADAISTKDLTVLDSFRLGRLMAAAGGFEGKLAEISVFNIAFSDAQVDEVMTAAESGPSAPTLGGGSSCIGYWPLATDSATHADQSGAGNGSFVATGTPVFDVDHPTIQVPAAPVNNLPMPQQSVQVGTPFSFDVSPYWINSPTGYSAVGLPNGLTISAAGIISGTPTGGFQ